MSAQVSAVTAHTHHSQANINRRSADYEPSIWGDRFLSYSSDFMEINGKVEHQQLKEEVKRMLMDNADNPSQKLEFIDAIQRLGVSYQFESEIDEVLKAMDNSHSNSNDLYTISLKFRLLRQQGYKTSCDVFNKFKDNQGNFMESPINDARGMLSLYEATHFRVHGEDILEEALAFSTTHLESMTAHLRSPLAAQISHALTQPIRKGLPRVEARLYFPIYEEDDLHNHALLKFAKLDFNILQKMHQKELSEIAKWWKELDFSNKLPFARDRIVECYFWILGVYFEPEYFLARRILTKVIAMTSVIDDIYDVFGVPEELELFTAAIERWDISDIGQLPGYMKICYKALLDVYEEIEKIVVSEGRSYRIYYAKEAMKNVVRAYFCESKWFHQQYVPTIEEYMAVALVSSGYPLLTTTSFIGMGDIVTEDSLDWSLSKPKMVTAASVVSRLMDDIVSHEFEQKRGDVASSIECYTKQYGVTEQEAVREFQERIADAWKDINEECLYPTSIPMPLLMRILNLARVMDVVYKDEDGYTHAGKVLKDSVSSLLIDRVEIM